MLVYFCISTHGYGHAARQAAVIEELYKLSPSWRFVISTAVNELFIKLVLKDIPYEYRYVQWDVGVIQKDALSVDLASTLEHLEVINRFLPGRISQEVEWIRSQSMPTIVVGDIPPSAADIAQRLNSPLIWMANFGWDDIYTSYGQLFALHIEEYKKKYSSGDLLLRCPFSLPMAWNLKEKNIGLTSPTPKDIPEAIKIRISNNQANTILVAFGGLGYLFNPELFNLWPDYLFLVPEQFNSNKFNQQIDNLKNVILLPSDNRIVDFLPYVSRHIGKPGYSSFCEGISNNVGMHVVSRELFVETNVLISGLKDQASHRLIDRNSFENGDWQIDQALNKPLEKTLLNNGSITAAKSILDFNY